MPRTSSFTAMSAECSNPTTRASASWSPEDDQTLLMVRAQGKQWGPISKDHFPRKTANACRKRHERLMEKRTAEDWDETRLARLAKEYSERRKEIWSPLADLLGEKWHHVEAKVIEKGWKNLTPSKQDGRKRTGTEDYYDSDSAIALESAEAEDMESGRRRTLQPYHVGASIPNEGRVYKQQRMSTHQSYYPSQYNQTRLPPVPSPYDQNPTPATTGPSMNRPQSSRHSAGPSVASLLSPYSQ